MLSDLDSLMAARGIGAVVVPMHEAMHASFRWLARGAQVTRGYAVKKLAADPVLFTYGMERGEAEKSGLSVVLVTDKRADTPVLAWSQLYDEILGDVQGSIAFYGNVPIQLYHGVIEELERRGRKVHRANGEDLIQLARKRKDPREIAIIADVGERTEQVVDDVRAALRGFKPGLKIGDLKAIVREGISRRGMLEDHETILSHGRDAGVPHSRGDANDVIREGVPIVLDIFPLDRETGYFFDLTRTFCVGRVPDDLRRLHADVLEAFERSRDSMKPGTPAIDYQNAVCDFFEAKGYATTRTAPATLEGYVHSLGHGVGLDIHEKPSFGLSATNLDTVDEGDIVTIEPGLYFPDRELGVRIEDTFAVERTGVRTLCRGSYALEP